MTSLPFAAPSCILPATVAENAAFLAHKVQEIGLYFFETKSCLAYTEEDVPPSLRALPVHWHMHLPVDLVWSRRQGGGAHAAKMALSVLEKAAFLRPRMAVLHPPIFEKNLVEQEKLLWEFLHTWSAKSSVPVLLENIQEAPLYTLDKALFCDVKTPEGKTRQGQKKPRFGVCLDVGHMLAFEQEELLLHQDLLHKVQLVHWSAPGKHDEHLALTQFTASQLDSVRTLISVLPPKVTHMIEVFHWQYFQDSVKILQQMGVGNGDKN